ncbi:MAG: hypothetical protein JXR76_07995 [Deltaproteobacteria bacterium]|nr:hypothetical protein [Deltaproteobacteria bacterium]
MLKKIMFSLICITFFGCEDSGSDSKLNSIEQTNESEEIASTDAGYVSPMLLSINASDETAQETGIVGWELALPEFQGDSMTAIGLNKNREIELRFELSVTPSVVVEDIEMFVDIESKTGKWQIDNGDLTGTNSQIDEHTSRLLSYAHMDMTSYQYSLEDTVQVGACLNCAIAGVGCVGIMATCIASGCGGVVACGACAAGVLSSCGFAGTNCYRCVIS